MVLVCETLRGQRRRIRRPGYLGGQRVLDTPLMLARVKAVVATLTAVKSKH